jgi:formylglycine-generating enzyme required for sulfatase activity
MSYRIFTLVLFFAITGSIKLSSQVCNDYPCKMELARAAFKKEQYKQALDQALGALYYDAGKKNEVDQFINAVYQAIEDKRIEAEKQRIEAEKQKKAADKAGIKLEIEKNNLKVALSLADSLRNDAIKAREEAELNFNVARQKEQDARNAQNMADSSLALYQRRSGEIVNLYMKEVNRLILEMKYEQAADTILIAAGFDNPTDIFRHGVSELVFWFAETWDPDKSVDLLISTKQGHPASNIDSIHQFLIQYDSIWYDTLISRYYGEWVFVKGGGYSYGSKSKITVQDFYMAKTETTFWQYGLYNTKYGSLNLPKESGWEHKGNEPIINVSWVDAVKYANWLSKYLGLQPVYTLDKGYVSGKITQDNGFRLPSQKEWEYAATGGQFHQYFNYAGSSINDISEVGWGPGNCTKTQPVGRKKPNILGIYDLSGNVWEYCQTQSKVNKINSNTFVLRGGAWNEKSSILKNKKIISSVTKNNSFGFRLILPGNGRYDILSSKKNIRVYSQPTQRKPSIEYRADEKSIKHFKSTILDSFIFNLDYQQATRTLRQMDIEQKRDVSLIHSIEEIVFWWNEIGKPEIASDLLKECGFKQIIAQSDSIRDFLYGIDKEWYSFLFNRYYGNMIPIQGGSFNFHRSTVAGVSSFKIARTETTLWQYSLFYESCGLSIKSKIDPRFQFEGDMPVSNITWFEALEYANWLSKKRGLQPVYRITKGKNYFASKNIVEVIPNANGYRLPTETEWEYAAKGGQNYNSSKYAGGDNFNEVAWGPQNCDGPQPVARKKPNALGIYDLSGNIAEWCWDRSNGSQRYPKVFMQDYQGPQTGSQRMIRGGSWKHEIPLIRRFESNSTFSPYSSLSPFHSNNKTGFRLVSGF